MEEHKIMRGVDGVDNQNTYLRMEILNSMLVRGAKLKGVAQD